MCLRMYPEINVKQIEHFIDLQALILRDGPRVVAGS